MAVAPRRYRQGGHGRANGVVADERSVLGHGDGGVWRKQRHEPFDVAAIGVGAIEVLQPAQLRSISMRVCGVMTRRASGGMPVEPGLRLFELSREPEQQRLAAPLGHELHADRQAISDQESGTLIAGWPPILKGCVLGMKL